jgi:hypothetical protein
MGAMAAAARRSLHPRRSCPSRHMNEDQICAFCSLIRHLASPQIRQPCQTNEGLDYCSNPETNRTSWEKPEVYWVPSSHTGTTSGDMGGGSESGSGNAGSSGGAGSARYYPSLMSTSHMVVGRFDGWHSGRVDATNDIGTARSPKLMCLYEFDGRGHGTSHPN